VKAHPDKRQRVAVIGGGIAGLGSAWLLADKHEVTLFEAADYAGGTYQYGGSATGRPVFRGGYRLSGIQRAHLPNLIALFRRWACRPAAPTCRSACRWTRAGRMGGQLAGTVFAQRSKLLSPVSTACCMTSCASTVPRRSLLQLPQRAADPGRTAAGGRLWTTLFATITWCRWQRHLVQPQQGDSGFPAATFLRFCLNHGLLQISQRPRWFTVPGGARQYVEKLWSKFRCAPEQPGAACGATELGVLDQQPAMGEERFDSVIFATHAPQTLAMLADASRRTGHPVRRALPANTAVLHGDAALPKRRKTWSAWNFLAETGQPSQRAVCVSYLLNACNHCRSASRSSSPSIRCATRIDPGIRPLRL
jgi:predicted NAD/FAD-binding protein